MRQKWVYILSRKVLPKRNISKTGLPLEQVTNQLTNSSKVSTMTANTVTAKLSAAASVLPGRAPKAPAKVAPKAPAVIAPKAPKAPAAVMVATPKPKAPKASAPKAVAPKAAEATKPAKAAPKAPKAAAAVVKEVPEHVAKIEAIRTASAAKIDEVILAKTTKITDLTTKLDTAVAAGKEASAANLRIRIEDTNTAAKDRITKIKDATKAQIEAVREAHKAARLADREARQADRIKAREDRKADRDSKKSSTVVILSIRGADKSKVQHKILVPAGAAQSLNEAGHISLSKLSKILKGK